VIEAHEHLTGCAACQQFVRDMRALGDAVRRVAPREQAPAEVRDGLFTAIARARAGTSASRRLPVPAWPLIAAAVVLFALGGAFTVDRLVRGASIDPIPLLVEDHARALSDAQIVSADPTAITRWLAGQVHFAMYVPALPGARFRGARLCILDGRRGAVVEYEVNGVAVSYFVVPVETDAMDAAGPAQFDRAARAGYRVVSWREPGLLHVMVGNLSDSRLATLAKACVEQARRAVVWLGGRVRSQGG
jgi:anti-sigma factor RsiW